MSVQTFPRLGCFVAKFFFAHLQNVQAYRGNVCGKFLGKAAGLRTKSLRPSSGLLQDTPKKTRNK